MRPARWKDWVTSEEINRPQNGKRLRIYLAGCEAAQGLQPCGFADMPGRLFADCVEPRLCGRLLGCNPPKTFVLPRQSKRL